VRTHRTFKHVLNETLRSALATDFATPEGKPFVVKTRKTGLRRGFDPLAFLKLDDDLEAAAFIELTRDLLKR